MPTGWRGTRMPIVATCYRTLSTTLRNTRAEHGIAGACAARVGTRKRAVRNGFLVNSRSACADANVHDGPRFRKLRNGKRGGGGVNGNDGAGHAAVAVPTYNERENVIPLLQAVHEALPDAHVLVIDDSSPDGTAEAVRGFMAEHAFVDLLVRSEKEGLGPAYVDGFRRLIERGFAYIIQMDCDFSHQPRFLPGLLAAAEAVVDLVIGSRYVPGGGTVNWGRFRQGISRGGSLYSRILLGMSVRDITGGYRCWRAATLEKAIARELLLKQFGFQVELAYRAHLLGGTIREIPIVFPERERGVSKMSGAVFGEALAGIWRLRMAGKSLLPG